MIDPSEGPNLHHEPGGKNHQLGSNMNPREQWIAGWIQRERERCRTYTLPFHRQWYFNIASSLGAIGVQAESIARALRTNIKKPTHRIRHSTNLIGPACRRLQGFLARSNPDIEIAAANLDDPLQVDMARGAEKWIPWHRQYDGYRKKELLAINWSVHTGLGILKAGWDERCGPRTALVDDDGNPLTDPQTGQPMLDERGKPILIETGMAHTSNISPFSYIYGVEAVDDEHLSWCGEDAWMPFSYLESIRANLSHGLVPEAQYQHTTGYYERQVAQSIGPSGVYAGLAPESDAEGARITIAYIAPFFLPHTKFGQEMYRDGAFLMESQGRLLIFEPNEMMRTPGVNPRMDWHPYSIFPCYSVPGRRIPQGVPENMIPVVDAINFIFSRVREAQRTMGQPKWLIPTGCGVSQKALGPEAGEKVYYNAGVGKPEAWTPPPMPAYLFAMLERAYKDVDLVASQPPMMQGQAQGQIRSGLAVQLLQEAAVTEYTPILIEYDEAKRRHVRQLLLREIQYGGDIPRRVQYRGTTNWEQESFFANLLSPDFTVQIMPGTSMPVSKALIMSEIDRMVAWGVLQPGMVPDHAELVARAMEYNVSPAYPGNEVLNLKGAREENARILLGDEPETLMVFNHIVHINEHIRFMISPKGREWQERDQTFIPRMMYHIGKHRFFLQMKQAGMDIPQPIPPFEDLQMQQPQGPQGQGGAGDMGMTNRGAPGATDQVRNQQVNGPQGGMNGQGNSASPAGGQGAPSGGVGFGAAA